MAKMNAKYFLSETRDSHPETRDSHRFLKAGLERPRKKL
jgi:hypothetical protein